MDDPTEYIVEDQDHPTKPRREKPIRPQKPRARKVPPPALPIREAIPYPSAKFEILSRLDSVKNEDGNLRPRLGRFTLQRGWVAPAKDGTKAGDVALQIDIKTPGMICGTRRGIVKHLSQDNLALARGAEWIHAPLEDFLEHPTPIPAHHPSALPLHGFLTHPPSSHIVSLSLRNPHDNKNMPANTNAFVQARTVRGVRKVGIEDWITWCKALRPDLIWALVDAPKTLTGVADPDSEGAEASEIIPGEGRQTSQKRTMKSMDRSWLWVEALLRGLTTSGNSASPAAPFRPPIIVPLMGGCDSRAREEFSKGLVDKLDAPIAQGTGIALKRVEEGVTGYAVELADLPFNELSTPPVPVTDSIQDAASDDDPDTMVNLLRASLGPLDTAKLRIAHSAPSPHVILRLIAEAGIDLFDAPWIAEAADLGIALDFRFPAPPRSEPGGPAARIGRSLFEERFAMDFEPIGELDSSWPCQPVFSDSHILHGRLDSDQWSSSDKRGGHPKAFTRAYVHHLLHTHEMSAYTLLHLHNLAVMNRFFDNIRSYMSQTPLSTVEFSKEIVRFFEAYDLPGQLFDDARRRWKEVEDARGKGSLKRERETLRNVQEAEQGAQVFAVDDAHPGEGMPKSDAIAVLEEAIEDRL
ncbi:hypothetical protein M408DRAFT_329615 [Serendipita vermifera MAFF 305830]|uniref:tRNA-guanine(15) transglycosylase-like domain-containing protein n=1 Tax=Serendipita vermifera MAFF 305830 TaxID=933852 RepID=A0A0C3AUN4_SERVB|nr:hypothetical protein M408DRAFT_329615 [Serendipita vermifera MAFF 305830]